MDSRTALLLVILLVTAFGAPVLAAGMSAEDSGRGGGVHPRAAWCSLYEGDGVSSPAAEGWTVRAFGTTSITGGMSGADTVAIVNDGTAADGAWMQRFMNFQPPFNVSVRGRYDPATARTGRVGLAYVFTGTHMFRASIYPASIAIVGAPALNFAATQGTWYNITFDAKAILDVDVYVNGVVMGNIEMLPTDRIIFDQPNNKAVIASLETDIAGTSLAMVDYIRTTMCPPTDVPAKTPDRLAPVTRGAVFADGRQSASNDLTVSVESATSVWLNATVDDTGRGGSMIWSANVTRGVRAWPGTPMAAIDGALDEVLEDVTTTIDITVLAPGAYLYCVYGRDYYGNKDLTGSCATLRVVPPGPPAVVAVTLTDGAQPPTPALDVYLDRLPRVWLNATVDDRSTGSSAIVSANYTVGPRNWPGTGMTAIDGAFDSPVESVTASPDPQALGPGTYALCVYARDAAGYANLNGTCATLRVLIGGVSSVDQLLPPWWNHPAPITATVTAGSFPVGSVDLHYSYLGGTGWTLYGSRAAAPWAWTFTFPDGEGLYMFYSVAWDTNGFEEDPPLFPDALAVFDATPPTSFVGPAARYWWSTGAVPLPLASSDLMSFVANVSVFYRWSATNLTGAFTPWIAGGTVNGTATSFDFTAGLGDGFYELRTQAVDVAGNLESEGGVEARLAVDRGPPATRAVPVAPYMQRNLPVALQAAGGDALSGLTAIELRYRYSADNFTWSSWQSLGRVVGGPYSWSFPAPDGEGYYEFASVGEDALGNAEPMPVTADARLLYSTTGSPTDIVHPRVVAVLPLPGAVQADPNTTVTVVFSEAMDEVPTAGAFSLVGPTGPVGGSLTWANGGSTLMFTPSGSLAWDALYTATVGTAAGDLAGNPLEAPYTWTFRTRLAPPGDIVPPRIVAAIPPADATNVPVDTDVRVYFSEPMDTSATEGAFSLSGPDGAVTGTVTWLGGGSTLVFRPSMDLRRNGTYTATVGASARDAAGNPLPQSATWSFRIEPEPAPAPAEAGNWKPVIALLFAVLLELATVPMATRMSRRPGAVWTRPLLIASVFAAVELVTGVVSMAVSALAVPPFVGAGLILDVVIFATGMTLVLAIGLAKEKAVPPP